MLAYLGDEGGRALTGQGHRQHVAESDPHGGGLLMRKKKKKKKKREKTTHPHHLILASLLHKGEI